MKWNIRKEGIDNYFLEYKDKMLPFHSRVGLVNDLQGSIKKARLRMVKELSEMGMSVNDLTKITSADGKTTYDNSNKQFIEESYINEENQRVLEDIMKKMFGMSFEELMVDIGIENEEEAKELASEIGNCLIGKTPRREQ